MADADAGRQTADPEAFGLVETGGGEHHERGNAIHIPIS